MNLEVIVPERKKKSPREFFFKVCNMASLIIITMQYIKPPEYTHLITRSLYTLISIKDVKRQRMRPENVTPACVLVEWEKVENLKILRSNPRKSVPVFM